LKSFSDRVLAWFDQYGRHDLPWQTPDNPYRVWLSEIMLQQTQVQTVIPYFLKFIERFPTVEALAAAPLDQVLAAWTGLGYYARARNLHRAAQMICQMNGEFPKTQADWAALPGIGRSTASAISAICFGERAAILDGNVKRVLARFLAEPDWPGSTAAQNRLWRQAEALLPNARLGDYTQAMMDLGATICTRARPQCDRCPIRSNCQALGKDLVSQLPKPKPRKSRPIKRIWMLIAQAQSGACFLEQRPPKGIWGGLHSFPEYSSLEALETDLPLNIQRTELAPFKHGFTHYELLIHPLHVISDHWTQDLHNTPGVWVEPNQSIDVGLSKPAVFLLNQVFEAASNPSAPSA
jgi:A/G-specific adenine glycosylase